MLDPLAGADGLGVTLVVLAAVLVLLVVLAVRIVPQSEAFVVTRLGRFHRVLGPGPNLILPILDRVHQRVDVKDRVLPELRLDVVSKDNVVFSIEAAIFYRVVEPEKAVFRVGDIEGAVVALVKSLVRAEIGKIELDMVQQDRQTIAESLREALQQASDDYGVNISRCEITDVILTPSTQKAMMEILEAERQRRATITRSEGQKRAVELAADAALYEAEKRAEAQIVTARATADAMGLIGAAIDGQGADAAAFQIAERQIAAMAQLAASPGRQTILYPTATFEGGALMAAALAQHLGGPPTAVAEPTPTSRVAGPWDGPAT
jgi:regulator of protease activity HflC (stomatin/prohibitin superfamily)